jgi:selenocysteine lyase/cysteine desulfurase
MRTIQFSEIEKSRKALATFLGVDSEELAITRNTTESLNIVIMGLNWKPGDEVVIGNQDYGSMVEAFQQAAARFGIVIKVANVPLLPKSAAEVTDAYISLLTNKTKLVHLTHTINLTGQVIDTNSIAKVARAKDILVAIDAAHSTAHVIDKIGILDADFIGGSLHKWLCTPIGLGYLVMKKQMIESVWPLMGDVGVAKNNIRKFEHQGTRPINAIQSIIPAIEFHNAIGFEAKLARLQYLKYAWLKQVDGKNGLRCISPWNSKTQGGAIATIQKENFSPNQLSAKLMDDYKIFTVAIDHPIVKGIRVTPHLSNKIEDISYFAESLLKF